jgi:hypothetical protein
MQAAQAKKAKVTGRTVLTMRQWEKESGKLLWEWFDLARKKCYFFLQVQWSKHDAIN